MASDVTGPDDIRDGSPKRREPRRRRVLMMVHEEFVPPEVIDGMDDARYFSMKTECDIRHALAELGHDVRVVGLREELAPLRKVIDEWKPHVVFNLLEEFKDQVVYDAHVVGYLELKGVAYTGCNPRGLVLARDKALSKKILAYHRIKAPRFLVFPRGKRFKPPGSGNTRNLPFPAIVKSLIAEGSEGIAQASIVHNLDALEERVRFIHESVGTDAIVEEFIDGREVYAGVIGNKRATVLPIWELLLDGLPDSAPRIATSKVKWDLKYQAKHGIDTVRARGLSEELEARIGRIARRIYRRLNIDGYARLDFRLTPDNQLYFLEANPNPDIAFGEELAAAAAHQGLDYAGLVQRLVSLGERKGR